MSGRIVDETAKVLVARIEDELQAFFWRHLRKRLEERVPNESDECLFGFSLQDSEHERNYFRLVFGLDDRIRTALGLYSNARCFVTVPNSAGYNKFGDRFDVPMKLLSLIVGTNDLDESAGLHVETHLDNSSAQMLGVVDTSELGERLVALNQAQLNFVLEDQRS